VRDWTDSPEISMSLPKDECPRNLSGESDAKYVEGDTEQNLIY
jgi:hypothetical protein